MGLKTVSAQERIEGGEVSEEMRLQDGTREESMSLVTRRKWTMRSTTVHLVFFRFSNLTVELYKMK